MCSWSFLAGFGPSGASEQRFSLQLQSFFTRRTTTTINYTKQRPVSTRTTIINLTLWSIGVFPLSYTSSKRPRRFFLLEFLRPSDDLIASGLSVYDYNYPLLSTSLLRYPNHLNIYPRPEERLDVRYREGTRRVMAVRLEGGLSKGRRIE